MDDDSRALGTVGAVALVGSGIIGTVAGLLHPDDTVAGSVFVAAWRPVHLGQILGFGLPALGAIALHPRLRQGWLANTAVVMTFLGSLLASGAAFVEATLLPRAVASLPQPVAVVDLLKPGSPLPELLAPMLSTFLVYIIGFVLLSIALLRSRALPRTAAILLLAGTLAQAAPLPGIGHGLTIAIHAVALGWIGVALLGAHRRPAPVALSAA